jgi:hypothetical protein
MFYRLGTSCRQFYEYRLLFRMGMLDKAILWLGKFYKLDNHQIVCFGLAHSHMGMKGMVALR